MGGMGSGRTSCYGSAPKCHEQRSIDIAWLERRRPLAPGAEGTLTWSRGEEVTGQINYRVEEGGLRLSYRTRTPGEDWRDVEDLIPFKFTATPFGGQRRWLSCPSCGKGCRIVYGGLLFRCRRCQQLRYGSQYEAAHERAASMAHKLRSRLGRCGGLDEPLPPKPKGMHWRTYRQLEDRDRELKSRWAAGAWAWLSRFNLPG